GGGAQPYQIDRTADDLYKGTEFPNYHYVKLSVSHTAVRGEMFRLDDPSAPVKHFSLKDTFELAARSDADPVNLHHGASSSDRIHR
ncbi:MAG TPA: hypothetical protein VH138_08135, partial [Vicinamibacterales bacterium]|nr:hypothetical protein [Vicinamibacterales bacterium]